MSAQPLKIVRDDRKHENVYDRKAARARVELTTVREGSCASRLVHDYKEPAWGRWGIKY